MLERRKTALAQTAGYRGLWAALPGAALLALAVPAQAVVARPCIQPDTYVRGGPIARGEAALRIGSPSYSVSFMSPAITLRRASGEAVPFALDARDDSWLLRPTEDMAVGAYQLEWVESCAPDGKFTTDLVVTPASEEPSELGELTLESVGVCPNVKVNLRLNLSEPILPDLAFLELDIQDDLGASWTKGLLRLADLPAIQLGSDNRTYVRSAYAECGESNNKITLVPLVPAGERAVIVRSRVVDGPELPELHAAASVVCGTCPPPVADAGAGAADADAGFAPLETDYGCTLVAGTERRGIWAAFALIALSVLVRARRARSAKPPRVR